MKKVVLISFFLSLINLITYSQWLTLPSPNPGIYYLEGRTGIGRTPTTSRLAVQGTVTCGEVIVSETYTADHVFKPGYELKPLNEVEQYVKTNRHLPGIAPAAEMQLLKTQPAALEKR